MPEPRVSLEDIIRSAAADLPPHKRTIVLTELLVDLDSARGLELLSQARSAISLRMQELIDERVGATLRDDEAGVSARQIALDPARAARPWEAFRSPAEAKAFLEAASAEELGRAAEFLEEDASGHPDRAVSKQHLAAVVDASERLWRRLTSAEAHATLRERRFRARGSSAGERS